jgi:hypothetical protein
MIGASVRFDGWIKCRLAERYRGDLIYADDFGTAKNQQNREQEPVQMSHNYK